MTLPFHPLANLFPLLEGAAFDELVADVRVHGVRERIVILDGQILDGRNRYLAACQAGLINSSFGLDQLPKSAARHTKGFGWRQFDLGADGDPLAWVLSKNLHRRHLSTSQRAMLAAEIAILRVGRPAEWNRPEESGAGAPLTPSLSPEGRGGEGGAGDENSANLRNLSAVKQAPTAEEAAEMVNVSPRSVETARQVREAGTPELVEAVRRGEVAVSAAAEVAKLPVSEQLEVLRSADPKAFARVARERQAELNAPNGARAIMADRREPDDSLDYFPTPPWATRALLEDVLGWRSPSASPAAPQQVGAPRIWEPACGEGHMSGVLLEYSPFVLATDVFDYSAPSAPRSGEDANRSGDPGRSPPGWDRAVDFLAGVGAGAEADWIITNPPFGDKSLAFILKALDVAQVGVAMFVRTQFLESLERYERLFATRPPTLIAQFAERVPLCKGRWDPDGDTATMYCWLVWQRGWLKGKPDGLQTSFRWIRPGRRIERSRADDVARFVTASPALPPAPEFWAEAPSIESRAPAGGPVEAGGAVPSASPASPADSAHDLVATVLALRPDCLVPECCRSPGGRALCHSCAKAKERGSVDLPAFLPPRPAEAAEETG